MKLIVKKFHISKRYERFKRAELTNCFNGTGVNSLNYRFFLGYI